MATTRKTATKTRTATKASPEVKRQRTRSVIYTPTAEESAYAGLVLTLGSIADDSPQWGYDIGTLDWHLRGLWPSEPILASALYTVVTRNAAFDFKLTGSPKSVDQAHEMFHRADNGKGWLDFITKWTTDYLSQNNGAHVELIRVGDSAEAPVIGFNHLDSCRCRRTGVPDWPIVYTDRWGIDHKLKDYQVYSVADMPSPIETLNGVGFCAIMRLLRECKRIRDIALLERERAQASDPNVIYLIGNVARKEMESALKEHKEAQLQKGFMRYMKPALIPTLDPKEAASMAKIELATMRPGYSKEEDMKWYLVLMAMAFGCDYQDFAPLPGGGLGTSNQSQILHQKSRGKGPAMFQKTIEHMMNFSGILPRNVEFAYDEQDVEADKQQAELMLLDTNVIQGWLGTGIIDVPVARQILLDKGYLSEEIVDMLGQADETPETAVGDEETTDKPDNSITVQDNEAEDETPEGDAAKDNEKAASRDYAQAMRLKLQADLQKDVEKALRKVFERIKKRLPTKDIKALKDSPDDILADEAFWDGVNQEMLSVLTPMYRKVMLKTAQYSMNLGLPVDMGALNTRMIDMTKTYEAEWQDYFGSDEKEALRKELLKFQEEGGKRGYRDLVDALAVRFGKERAQVIATTEFSRMFNRSNTEANKAAGVTEEVWKTGTNAFVEVCQVCKDLAGKHFPVGQGPQPPSDTHPLCRCWRQAVVGGKVIGE